MSAILVWIIIAGICLTVEITVFPAFVFLFFGIGGLVGAVAAWLTASPEYQIAVFVFVSVVSLFCLRRLLRRTFNGTKRQASSETKEHPMSGMRGIAREGLKAGQSGRIALGGSYWRAVSEKDVEAGASVVVIGNLKNDELTVLVETSR